MLSVWTKHLKSEEEKLKFQERLHASKDVLDRLGQIIDEKEAELDRSQKTFESYDSPSWSHKQAHKNGYSSCLSSFKQLTNLDNR